MSIRDKRLQRELLALETLSRQSSFISFSSNGNPPEEYLVTFTCRGLVTPMSTSDEHVARIYLSAEFPRAPPQVSFLTPSFHPNIAQPLQMGPIQAEIQRLLNSAPDDNARKDIEKRLMENEELFKVRVCLDTLDLAWSPSITLDLICIELAEMIQYKRYNPADPLNHQAAAWALQNRDKLPVDSRSILDEKALAGIRVLDEITFESDEPKIRLL